MHTKRFHTFFKRWVQLRVGAIPRLPKMIASFWGTIIIVAPIVQHTHTNKLVRIEVVIVSRYKVITGR